MQYAHSMPIIQSYLWSNLVLQKLKTTLNLLINDAQCTGWFVCEEIFRKKNFRPCHKILHNIFNVDNSNSAQYVAGPLESRKHFRIGTQGATCPLYAKNAELSMVQFSFKEIKNLHCITFSHQWRPMCGIIFLGNNKNVKTISFETMP